jgi:ATP-dependent helicase/nuclease subunit B
MFNELLKNLNSKTVIITPNRRLAINLREEFDSYQSNSQKMVWEKANIQFLDDWLVQLFGSLCHNYVLLNSYQEQALWEKIIAASEFWSSTLANLNSISDLATTVQKTWKLVRQWSLKIEQWISLPLTENCVAFKAWAEGFIDICQTNHWVDKYSIINVLIDNRIVGKHKLPLEIILINFDQIYPQLDQLIAVLKAQGSKITHFDLNNNCGCQHKIALANTEQELKVMALWAKECIRKNPQAKIGCVIHNLKTMRNQVENVFYDIYGNNFDISIGQPLALFPIIADALKALNLGLEGVAINDVVRLLRSPFFYGGEQEMLARAMLGRCLRQSKEYIITVRQILSLTKQVSRDYFCPILSKQVDAFLITLKEQAKKQTYHSWANCFIKLLNSLEWGKGHNLTSGEYQSIECWQLLLKEFATLDLVEEELPTFADALNKLNIIANSRIFQPKLLKVQPVKILGVLEAAGLNFDNLWIMGLTDEDWPPIASPDPFIPLRLQKKLFMPHVNAERELAFCQKLIERFNRSATNIIYSYPLQNREQEANPSSLIVGIPVQNDELPKYKGEETSPLPLENIIDHQAPPVTSSESIRGGIKIFKLQAACPFRAFAECRLMAQELETPKIGLDYIERGNLVHATLTRFWNLVNDHQQLSIYAESELRDIISQCIAKSLTELSSSVRVQASYATNYLQLEHQRLQKILFDWMQLEKQRSKFKVVAKEQTFTITIANIEMQLRMDRVDELEDGSLLIIDYKTGEVSSLKKWDDERLDDPQLPLYCIVADKALNGGAVIAQLKNGRLGFLGVTKKDYGFTKSVTVVDNWHEILVKWQSILEKLGDDFCQGCARVDPKYGEKTCNQCFLQSLCRV